MGLTREAPPKAPAAPRPTRVRPVVLATLSVRVDPSAERMAIDSALEAGAPLILVNLLKLRNYPTTIALLGAAATTLPHEEDLDAVRERRRVPRPWESRLSCCASPASGRSQRCWRCFTSAKPAWSYSVPT